MWYICIDFLASNSRNMNLCHALHYEKYHSRKITFLIKCIIECWSAFSCRLYFTLIHFLIIISKNRGNKPSLNRFFHYFFHSVRKFPVKFCSVNHHQIRVYSVRHVRVNKWHPYPGAFFMFFDLNSTLEMPNLSKCNI